MNSTQSRAPSSIPVNVLFSDRFLDLVLDELTERAGHARHTNAFGFARWDLKAAVRSAIEVVYR